MAAPTQNISIPTTENANLILSLASHTFENHAEEIGNAVVNKNFVRAYLKMKAEETVVGGLDFAEPVLINENTNFAFRNHYSPIAANTQDPMREFKFEPMTLTGTLVINKKHQLMNTGKPAFRKLMTTLKTQAESTLDNIMNTAAWKATPTDGVDPESIPSIVSSTPTTGTIGGIARAGNTYAQNKVNSSTVSDAGSEAGVAALEKFRIELGGDAKTRPDFAVTTTSIYSNIYAYMYNNVRLRANEKMVALDLDQFYLGSALLGYDGNGGTGECPSSRVYFLNSKHLFLKVLDAGGGRTIVFEPFSFKDNSLNATSVVYCFYNLTTNLPSSLGVMTAVS